MKIKIIKTKDNINRIEHIKITAEDIKTIKEAIKIIIKIIIRIIIKIEIEVVEMIKNLYKKKKVKKKNFNHLVSIKEGKNPKKKIVKIIKTLKNLILSEMLNQ